MVVTAEIVYTDQHNIQDSALAYATHNLAMGNVLGANVWGSGFLPDSFFGWLLLIILILLLLLLAKHLYRDVESKRYLPPATHYTVTPPAYNPPAPVYPHYPAYPPAHPQYPPQNPPYPPYPPTQH